MEGHNANIYNYAKMRSTWFCKSSCILPIPVYSVHLIFLCSVACYEQSGSLSCSHPRFLSAEKNGTDSSGTSTRLSKKPSASWKYLGRVNVHGFGVHPNTHLEFEMSIIFSHLFIPSKQPWDDMLPWNAKSAFRSQNQSLHVMHHQSLPERLPDLRLTVSTEFRFFVWLLLTTTNQNKKT